MTNPTDEELDAAIAGLQSMVADHGDKRTWEGAASKLGNGVAAIRTLRVQLAEVQAELAFVTENRNKWQDAATRRWFRIEEANAQADLAEAARAAQIEAAAWQPIETAPRDGSWFVARTKFGTIRVVHYADCADRYPIAHDDKAWSTAPTEWMPISFRAKPHDHTALDRMLAEAREKALRETMTTLSRVRRWQVRTHGPYGMNEDRNGAYVEFSDVDAAIFALISKDAK